MTNSDAAKAYAREHGHNHESDAGWVGCPCVDAFVAGADWVRPARKSIDDLIEWQRKVADALGVSEGPGPGYPWHCAGADEGSR